MCYDDKARPPLPPGAPGTARGSEVVLTASDGNRFAAFRALPEAAPSARVLIFPDVRGLHQFYKDLAMRFAEIGIAATAMDYFGRTAGIGARDESFEYMPHVQQLTLEGIQADTAATLAELASQGQAPVATFTVGFCLGGTVSLLTGAEHFDLAGVIGFYAGMSRSLGNRGTLLERAGEIRRPVLGLFGGADRGIPVETVAAFDTALDAAGVDHTIVIYPGAPHSFFDRQQEQYAQESADAWQQVLTFIAKHTSSQAQNR